MTIQTTCENSPELDHSEWLPLLCLGAQEVFEMMAGMTLTPCPSPDQPIFAQFTAMVGLAGPICGVFSVRCTNAAAASIASSMLGTPTGADKPETRDALGEICNMVVGHFKHKLGEMGQASMLSVPTVIQGSHYRVRSVPEGKIIESCLKLSEELIQFRLNYKVSVAPPSS